MANVMEILAKIKTAIYGEDVRQSIYDAILQCYKDATGNPESIAAHTGDTDNPHNVTAKQIGLSNPEFDDYTAEGSEVPDSRDAIASIVSRMSIFSFFSKTKAALMGLVTLGEMRSLLINNGLTTESGKYFLDAAYAKTLKDLIDSNKSSIDQLNGEVVKTTNQSSGKIVKMWIGKYNDTQNYLQFSVNGIDKGYILFTVSRNIDA